MNNKLLLVIALLVSYNATQCTRYYNDPQSRGYTKPYFLPESENVGEEGMFSIMPVGSKEELQRNVQLYPEESGRKEGRWMNPLPVMGNRSSELEEEPYYP